METKVNCLEFSSCSGSSAFEPSDVQSLRSLANRTHVRPKIRKDMQKEIIKYQGRIFYFAAAGVAPATRSAEDEVTKEILPASWIKTLADYNHNYAELHHVIPYTDWETNTKDVRDRYINALILIPKVMHQHLENPEYKLPKEVFKKVYGIDPDKILLDVNSRIPRSEKLFTEDFVLKSLFDSDIADCFSNIDFKEEQAKYTKEVMNA